MQIDETQITASIYHKTTKGILYAKVSFPDIGLHVNSISVRQSPRSSTGLWVQPPAIPNRGKFIKPMEFERTSFLWSLIEDAVLRAVDEYGHGDNEWPPP